MKIKIIIKNGLLIRIIYKNILLFKIFVAAQPYCLKL